MSKTIRWWQKPHNFNRIDFSYIDIGKFWKTINPYFFRHERKQIRVEQHRVVRHRNNIEIKKAKDVDMIELENIWKTNGWGTW